MGDNKHLNLPRMGANAEACGRAWGLTSLPYIMRWWVVMSALKTTIQLLLEVRSSNVSARWGMLTFSSLVQWIRSGGVHKTEKHGVNATALLNQELEPPRGCRLSPHEPTHMCFNSINTGIQIKEKRIISHRGCWHNWTQPGQDTLSPSKRRRSIWAGYWCKIRGETCYCQTQNRQQNQQQIRQKAPKCSKSLKLQ